MKIGFIGLGKLGLPVALAIESRGHSIRGWDTDQSVREAILRRQGPAGELEAQALLPRSSIQLVDLPNLVSWSDIIFVCVQTPHEELFEGTAPMPTIPQDFNYDFLRCALEQLGDVLTIQQSSAYVIVVSTCLPGTFKKTLAQVVRDVSRYVYNPLFIAMGSVVADFLRPEFVLLGTLSGLIPEPVRSFYESIHDRTLFCTDIKTAELIKVGYNTYIGQKILFANTMMEICHKMGANVDDLSEALALSTDRIISPKYLRGGMGDGGGCHPRDNIALSSLARSLQLSYNLFETVVRGREAQCKWLAELAVMTCERANLPLVLLGSAFKAKVPSETGSPAILWLHFIQQLAPGKSVTVIDPYISRRLSEVDDSKPSVFFVGANHPDFGAWSFPKGSIVLDPWGTIPSQSEVEVMHIGRP